MRIFFLCVCVCNDCQSFAHRNSNVIFIRKCMKMLAARRTKNRIERERLRAENQSRAINIHHDDVDPFFNHIFAKAISHHIAMLLNQMKARKKQYLDGSLLFLITRSITWKIVNKMMLVNKTGKLIDNTALELSL